MGVDGRIPVKQDDVFPAGLILMAVESSLNFNAPRDAADRQERDKTTGERVWQVSCIDLAGRTGQHEIKIKMTSPHQPVPTSPAGEVGVAFTGLEVVPYVKTSGSGSDARHRVAFSYRATGFAPARQMASASSK